MKTKTQALIRKYATAFVDVVLEVPSRDEIVSEIVSMLDVFEQTDLATSLSSISLSSEQKAQLLGIFQENSSTYVRNFLEVIKQNGREELLYPILLDIRSTVSRRTNQFDVTVQTVVPLSEEQKAALSRIAEARFGIQTRQIVETIDEELIGGFVLAANNKVIDTSIKSQLHAFKQTMK